MSQNRKNIKLVVFGDIGRSPRMQYHAVSLAEMGHKVDIIGYGETAPLPQLKSQPLVFYHYLLPVPSIPIKLLNYVFKTIFQTLNLFFLLLVTGYFDIILVQNPPAIPALIVCWIYSRILSAQLIIDWHNYAHTIMALNNGENLLVKITRNVEKFIGRKANYNLCVTNAMRHDLDINWNITATTLHDKPPTIFHSISAEEKGNFLQKLGQVYFKDSNTIAKELEKISQLKDDRPGLLVSSTSWTEDEDFSILLEALQDYENHCNIGNDRCLPQLICVITGKGPLKNYYQETVKKFDWKFVKILMPWLDSEDYPKILASADLGVSLHTSSSGLDLPMKVVDMFGCGLPVCALDFPCLDELVQHERNGYKFRNAEELAKLLLNWFEHFPNNAKQQEIEERFRIKLEDFQKLRWEENWTEVASPFFK